jgi:phosphoribosyl 1,2-cyclic phosphodiesterase
MPLVSSEGGFRGAIVFFWRRGAWTDEGQGMGRSRIRPVAGPETTRYGGNTSCVQVTLSDGTVIVLDAGTGIRNLGLTLAGRVPHINLLLTHSAI